MKTCGSICRWFRAVFFGGAACWLLFWSCAVLFRGEGTGRRERDETRVERSDPLAFAGDEVIVTQIDIGLPDYSGMAVDTAATRPQPTTPADSTAEGYDVQFYATLNILKARQVQQQVDTLTGMPVRVLFAEPYYKVLAGPYRSFEEAETFLRAVTRLGFSSAWIVGHKAKTGK